MKIKNLLLALFVAIASTAFFAMASTAPVTSVADIPDHGWGRVLRVNNKTDFNMDIYFDKTIHDLLPEGTIARLRSFDPKLGTEGKLIRIVQEAGEAKLKADGTDPKDKTTQFEVKRRIAPDLSDWLGFSGPSVDNKVMRAKPDTFHVALDTKDFLLDEHKHSHWKLSGKDLSECRLESRLGGFMQNLTLNQDYALGKDEEKIEYAQDLWCCNYPDTFQVVKAQYGIDKPPFEVTYGEYWGTRTWKEKVGSHLVQTGSHREKTGRHWNWGKARYDDDYRDVADYASVDDFQDRSERKSADIKNWIRDRINESGFYEIPAKSDGAFGDPCSGFAKRTDASVKVLNDIVISSSTGQGQGQRVEIFNDVRVAARLEEIRNSKSAALIAAISADLRASSVVNWAPGEIHTRVGDPWPGIEKKIRVTVAFNGSNHDFTGSDSKGITIDLGGDPYRFENNNWSQKSSGIRLVAVGNKDAVYGIRSDRTLARFDGNNWNKIETSMPIGFVAVSPKGDVFILNADNNTMWHQAGGGFKQLPGLLKRISARSLQELWGVGTDDKIYKFDGTDWKKQDSFNGGAALDVSVGDNGAVWATNTEQKVFRYDGDGKGWTLIPGAAKYITARSDQEVFAVNNKNEIWHYLNGNWNQLPGSATNICAASGVNRTVIPAKRAIRTVETFTVRNQENKPAEPNDGSKIAIEIVKLGMGGGIPAKSAGDFVKIPVYKNPRVSGFAKYQIPEINQGSLIKINPLRSQGAAWLENTLHMPGSASVSFSARPGSAGDVQVIFGQSISDSFVWKVVIGGWGNTKSAIMKRTYEGGIPKDVFVCEVGRDQNPLAMAVPGSFTPYWASINNGLILVGVGNVGENTFMAWRDPNPPDDVNTCGFGSYKNPISYTEIQVLPAVDAQGTHRTYKIEPKPLTVTADTKKVTWLDALPFRVVDRGSVAATIQANGSAVLILGSAKSLEQPHYAVVFGDDNNKKISLKKWVVKTKSYVERASLRYDTYPGLVCKTDKKMRFWISFNSGAIALGSGTTGENTLLVIQDLNSHTGISQVGIGSFGTTPATFSGIEIGSPIDFGIESQLAGYKQASATFQYAGNMTIVTPFEYRFSQEDQAVKLTDLVNDSTYYPGGTPQQGALYDFMFTVQDDGTPKLDWTNEPSNPQKLALEQRVLKLNADADLARATKDIMNQSAAIAKSVKVAEAARISAVGAAQSTSIAAVGAAQAASISAVGGAQASRIAADGATKIDDAKAQGDIKRAEYQAALTTGDKIAQAGTQIAGATSGGGPIVGGLGLAVGAGLIAGGLVKSAMAEGMLKDAAQADAQGVYAASGSKRQANATTEAADSKAATTTEGASTKAATTTEEASTKAALTTEEAQKIEAQMQQKALERDSQAAELENQAKLAAGEASAFRKVDAYVYTDQAPRATLGSSSIPDEAVENRQALEEKVINATMSKRPSTRALFEEILSLYKYGMNLIIHFHVIDKKSIKQQLIDTINTLVNAYPKLYGSDPEINEGVHNDLINLLMAARNNPYLIDSKVADQAKMREVWFADITQLSRQLLSSGQSHSIELNNTFGEYIWLTEEAGSEDVAEISFDAQGLNDIFIGFVDDTVPVRNSTKEFYEVVLGAWDNTRNVVRLKSLDKSVFEVKKNKQSDTMLTRMEFEHYTIRFDHGKITATKGAKKKVILQWQDPYPITDLRRIGIASWNSPITFKNIMLNGKIIGKRDSNLAALSTANPTEAINQAIDHFTELENALGQEVLETTDDPEVAELMDSLEETIANAAANGYAKRRTMNVDDYTNFGYALDGCYNWLASDEYYKKVAFYLKTVTEELKRKGVTLDLTQGKDSRAIHQTATGLAELNAAKEAAAQASADEATQAADNAAKVADDAAQTTGNTTQATDEAVPTPTDAADVPVVEAPVEE